MNTPKPTTWHQLYRRGHGLITREGWTGALFLQMQGGQLVAIPVDERGRRMPRHEIQTDDYQRFARCPMWLPVKVVAP